MFKKLGLGCLGGGQLRGCEGTLVANKDYASLSAPSELVYTGNTCSSERCVEEHHEQARRGRAGASSEIAEHGP